MFSQKEEIVNQKKFNQKTNFYNKIKKKIFENKKKIINLKKKILNKKKEIAYIKKKILIMKSKKNFLN